MTTIIWEESPRRELEAFVLEDLLAVVGEDCAPEDILFHHVALSPGDYNGPSVLCHGDGSVLRCQYVMPTEGGGDIGLSFSPDNDCELSDEEVEFQVFAMDLAGNRSSARILPPIRPPARVTSCSSSGTSSAQSGLILLGLFLILRCRFRSA